MKTRNDMNITQETEHEHILNPKKEKKNQVKKSENKFMKNLKDSICCRPPSSSKQKLTNKLKQDTTNTTAKKVKFNKVITIIDVESWKNYNKDQTTLDISDDEEEDNKINKIKKKKKKKKNNKNDYKKDNISCTCIII